MYASGNDNMFCVGYPAKYAPTGMGKPYNFLKLQPRFQINPIKRSAGSGCVYICITLLRNLRGLSASRQIWLHVT